MSLLNTGLTNNHFKQFSNKVKTQLDQKNKFKKLKCLTKKNYLIKVF